MVHDIYIHERLSKKREVGVFKMRKRNKSILIMEMRDYRKAASLVVEREPSSILGISNHSPQIGYHKDLVSAPSLESSEDSLRGGKGFSHYGGYLQGLVGLSS